MENQLKKLFPSTQIHFALLLAAFIDLPSLPSPSQPIHLSTASQILQRHNHKFQRGFCAQVKKYILSTLLDLDFISLTNCEDSQKDEFIDWTKIIDMIQIQYHREKLLIDKIEPDVITLYEELDKERRGYISLQIIMSYIQQYDPQSKTIKRENFQPSHELKSKFYNNLHYTVCQEKNENFNVVQLQNFVQLFGRINNEDSITYKTLDGALQQLTQREYLNLLQKNHKKLKNHRQKHDENIFQQQFQNTKAIAYKIVGTPCCVMKTSYEKNDDKQTEYETIKRKIVQPSNESSQKTARNDLSEKSKKPQSQSNPETHLKQMKLNRGERILMEVDRLLVERVKTRLKLYDVLGL